MIARLSNRIASTIAVLALCVTAWSVRAADDPLPSWNDGPAKQAITAFVAAVTTMGSADFVLPADRIATFDQDSTLWAEHPLRTQAEIESQEGRLSGRGHPSDKVNEG